MNEWRYYRLEVWPDLFGGALLMRHWGRIGTAGRVRLDQHRDQAAAIKALAEIVRVKCKRGEQRRGQLPPGKYKIATVLPSDAKGRPVLARLGYVAQRSKAAGTCRFCGHEKWAMTIGSRWYVR
jgi:predicted DNA-binding WGR domain protein